MSLPISRRNAAKSFLAVAAGGLISPVRGEAATAVTKNFDETIRTQVCVIGGGSGGTGAALAAARAGADVVLLERDSILGGTATTAFVNIWRPVTGGNGIPRELFMAMAQDPSALTLPPDCDLNAFYNKSQLGPRNIGGKDVKRGVGVNFEPRAMDYTVRRLLDETGRCRTLLATTFYRAHLKDNRITAVEAWFNGKRILIEAVVFIDCTADGDVCKDAGCEYNMGEDPRSRYNEPDAPEKARLILNGLTLCYRITDTGVKQKPYLPQGVKENSCSLSACYDRMPNGDIVINVPGMIGGNALITMEYSELMRKAHQKVLAHMHSLQQLPANDRWAGATKGKGWSTWAISAIAPRIGVRETRRLVCNYVLNENDCVDGLPGQTHNDIVAIADHHIDIHGSGHFKCPFPKAPFGIPFRCLQPKGVANLMIASRAAGFSHIASGAARLQRTLITLGQAAGNAAAMAAAKQIRVDQVDVKDLQARLVKQSVDITA